MLEKYTRPLQLKDEFVSVVKVVTTKASRQTVRVRQREIAEEVNGWGIVAGETAVCVEIER